MPESYGIEGCVVHQLEIESLEVKVKGISGIRFSLSIFDYTFINYYSQLF